MASISELKSCAGEHLRDFTCPRGHRSFLTYDRRGNPAKLDPLDVLAPGLLDAPISSKEINQMFNKDEKNPYNILRQKIDECLAELSAIEKRDAVGVDFADADLNSDEGPWSLVRACLRASEHTPNIKAAKVSKILHRKHPTFIPIIDSKLAGFYEVTMAKPWEYWPKLQMDFKRNRDFLNKLAEGVLTSEGVGISPLRVADIVIWEHLSVKCKEATIIQ